MFNKNSFLNMLWFIPYVRLRKRCLSVNELCVFWVGLAGVSVPQPVVPLLDPAVAGFFFHFFNLNATLSCGS